MAQLPRQVVLLFAVNHTNKYSFVFYCHFVIYLVSVGFPDPGMPIFLREDNTEEASQVTLPSGDNPLPISPLYLAFQPLWAFTLSPVFAGVHPHLLLSFFCCFHNEISAKDDRLTVTSVFELDTDWRLIFIALKPCSIAFDSNKPSRHSSPFPPLLSLSHTPKGRPPLCCTKIEHLFGHLNLPFVWEWDWTWTDTPGSETELQQKATISATSSNSILRGSKRLFLTFLILSHWNATTYKSGSNAHKFVNLWLMNRFFTN